MQVRTTETPRITRKRKESNCETVKGYEAEESEEESEWPSFPITTKEEASVTMASHSEPSPQPRIEEPPEQPAVRSVTAAAVVVSAIAFIGGANL